MDGVMGTALVLVAVAFIPHTLGYPEDEMNKQRDIHLMFSPTIQYSRWILRAYIFRVSSLDDTDLIWIMKKEETKQGGQRLFPKKDP